MRGGGGEGKSRMIVVMINRHRPLCVHFSNAYLTPRCRLSGFTLGGAGRFTCVVIQNTGGVTEWVGKERGLGIPAEPPNTRPHHLLTRARRSNAKRTYAILRPCFNSTSLPRLSPTFSWNDGFFFLPLKLSLLRDCTTPPLFGLLTLEAADILPGTKG